MTRFYKISILLYFFASGILFGQLESPAGNISGIKIDSWYDLNLDNQIISSMAGIKAPKDSPFQFAIPVTVNLTPSNSGCIYSIGNELVWIVGVRSKSAKSLNLILDPFEIPKGSYIYVYDKARTTIRGAYGSDNNNESHILPLLPVPGEELILEYHIPQGINIEGTIGISQVAHDYVGIFDSGLKDSRYNLSQPCNVDINCPAGSGYEKEARSVCRIIVRGIELCSGVLINNTNQQNRPLLITAQHCVTDNNDASKSIFVFGYESPWCKGPDGRVIHSVSGSLLQATNASIDFSLVELSSFPPITYKPYLAGWDVSGIPPSKTAAIHHPEGDVKKISVDNDAPVTATFSGSYSNGFWKILQWESGTTEGGSSGSPLFDQNKRVVGILTGGEAICGRSVNDYFAKLSVIYDLSSLLWEQLKGWIDPAKTGVKQLNGRDPYAFNLLTVDTLYNFIVGETHTRTIYNLPGSGYATGFNSDSLVMYAEHFDNPSGRQISEVLINISKANSVLSADSARIYIFGDGSVPGTPIASQRIWLNEAKDTFLLKVDFKSTLITGTGFYVGWRIWYKDKALSETRQFAPFHSPDRGISGLNTAWFSNGTSWKQFTQHPSFPMSVSLDVKVVTFSNSIIDKIELPLSEAAEFIIYPNPAKDFIIIKPVNLFHKIIVRISGMEGNQIYSNNFYPDLQGELKIDISGFASGVYIVSIDHGTGDEVHKLIITR